MRVTTICVIFGIIGLVYSFETDLKMENSEESPVYDRVRRSIYAYHCGRQHGKQCTGEYQGNCCSTNGYCGTTPDYCGKGCQNYYGPCH